MRRRETSKVFAVNVLRNTWFLLFALLGVLHAQTASAPAAEFVHVRVEGPLDVGTQSLVARAIREARERRIQLVLELDTPGGPIDLMWELANMLDQASSDGVPTTAWVNDKALSAGALLAIACDRIYMNPHGVIGAAMPVTEGPQGGIIDIPDSGVREKITAATRSSFRAFAEKKKRPAALAEAMVDRDVEVREVKVDGERKLITGVEWDDARDRGDPPELVSTVVQKGKLLSLSADQANRFGLADGLAANLAEVVEKLGLTGATAVPLERARSEDLAALLDQFKYILLAVAILAAWAEFKAPGFGLPGIVSIVCFALFLFGQYLVGIADVWEIVAVVAGLVLVAVEIFVLPGVLWAGIVGALLVIGGIVAMAVGPNFDWSYAINRQRLVSEAFSLAVWLVVTLMVGLFLSRFIQKTPVVRRMVLAPAGDHSAAAFGANDGAARVGALGRASTDLRPVGKVSLDADGAREHEARASGSAIDRGARVRVVEVSTGRLVVEPLVEGEAG